MKKKKVTDSLYKLRMIQGKSGLLLPEQPKEGKVVVPVSEAEREQIRLEARARAQAARAAVAEMRARKMP